jgi:hypothetical protein
MLGKLLLLQHLLAHTCQYIPANKIYGITTTAAATECWNDM